MADMTVCLLNYKRPENLPSLLGSLASQKCRPKVFLWDNSVGVLDVPPGTVDWMVRSWENRGCWPRWLMASQADTPYVMSLDDDLALASPDVVGRLVEVIGSAHFFDRIYGLEGVLLQKGKTYEQCLTSPAGPNGEVDVVKGRLMVLRRDALEWRLRLLRGEGEDDIAVSALMAAGRPAWHRTLPWLKGAVRELPDHDAVCKRQGHMARRDEAVRRFFGVISGGGSLANQAGEKK